MKLIAAAFCTAMALLMTWVACWLAIDETHAWKVTTTLSAFIFAFVALASVISWFVENDGKY
jgi:hypothetical protein